MARHKSAEKRARQAVRRQARNTAVDSSVKTKVRAFREAIESGERDKAKAALAIATQELQKAAGKGVLHKRNASRRVSRLTLAFNAAAPAAK